MPLQQYHHVMTGDVAASGMPKTSPSSASTKKLPVTPTTVNSLNNKKNQATEAAKMKRKKKLSLPWWCVVIAWVLCAISIAVSVFFLWAYGIQFGNEKATKWLTALISSIFSSILFTQPIKIYLMAMILSWILKRPLDEFEDYDDDEEEFELSSDEEFLHGPPSSQGKRLRSHNQLGAGLSKEELAAAKDHRKRELAMQELMLEIFVYLIFLTIILSISYGARDPNIFLMRNNMANTFAHFTTSGCPSFLEANEKQHFWCWAREVLVPNLLNTTLYNGEHRPQEMCGTLVDRITFLLGHAIIRQIRVKPGDPSEHPARHENTEDKRNFGRNWNISGPEDSNYQYRSALQIHGFPYEGVLSIYSGGGYIVELKGVKSKVMRLLDSLEEQNWVDAHTKALFVEYAVFNAQVNLFAITMFIIEFIPGGGILTKFEFQGLRLLRYHTSGGVFMLVSEIAYILFTFFYTQREYKALKKLGCSYFKSLWNLFEIWMIALSYTAIIFYLLKTSLTYYTLDKFTATKGKTYIRMQPLAFLDDVLGYVIAFQVFIGTLKLLRLLRFNKRIGMLSATLKHASGDILGFGLFFGVVFVSFVTIFYLNCFTYVKDFSTFVRAAESSFFLITKKFKEIRLGAPVFGPLFYFIFAFIMYWIVFQLLIAIICHSFAKVSEDIASQPNDYEVVDYIISRMSAYLSSLRPNSVQNINIPPEKAPDLQSQLWHINTSLDRSLAILDRALPTNKKRGI
ncbi:polycystin-1-like protein 2 [Cherax quadricarinatus]|uniref:polycystin-1-like protein 2 n=1 Tax=Cherax quadricarinatus TaxID=27406 RepID=UPI00387EB31B